MSDSFLTIDAAPGEGVDVELEVKRSRFLTRLRRVSSEAEARAVVEGCRSRYFDARHHCSAFILGPDARTARSSDDGEPAGTAGVPMLSALQHHGLTDVAVVVTRYFGGILLGAGGLVRAYTEAVGQAVSAAHLRRVQLCCVLAIDVSASAAGALEDQLRRLTLPSGAAVVVDGVDWAQRASIRLSVPAGEVDDLRNALNALSGGVFEPSVVGQRWVDQQASPA